MIPPLGAWQWCLGALSVFLVGVAKTGVPGVGILSIPMMVLAVGDARFSAGYMLPILCTADVIALFLFRQHASATRLISMVPWVLLGMAGGAWALGLPESKLRPMVGAIIIVMISIHILRIWRGGAFPAQATLPQSVAYGASAGFASTVANAAGPVMNLYLLSKQLPKAEFVATGAWFFFFVNASKLPIYIGHGLFSRTSLTFDAMMLPVLALGAGCGRALFFRIPQKTFERVVLALSIVATLLLFL
ncbi:MAG: sulfite exporter TauE/SafE family protein [Bryobacteraceae bacterium]